MTASTSHIFGSLVSAIASRAAARSAQPFGPPDLPSPRSEPAAADEPEDVELPLDDEDLDVFLPDDEYGPLPDAADFGGWPDDPSDRGWD